MPNDNHFITEQQESEGIELGELFAILLANIKLIIVSAIVAGLIVFAVSYFFITPLYTASVTIYVNNAKSTETERINSADLAASQSLVNTYIAIIQSNTVLSEVSRKLNEDTTVTDTKGNYTPERLFKMMSATAVSDTEIFKVSIENENPVEAADIANQIAEATFNQLPEYIEGSSVKIVDNANIPVNPSSPNIMKNTAIGIMIGLILSVLYAVAKEMFDTRIKTEADIEMMFGLPVLGRIPDFVYTSQHGKSQYERSKGGADFES